MKILKRKRLTVITYLNGHSVIEVPKLSGEKHWIL